MSHFLETRAGVLVHLVPFGDLFAIGPYRASSVRLESLLKWFAVLADGG
jgi:hypothetical protein